MMYPKSALGLSCENHAFCTRGVFRYKTPKGPSFGSVLRFDSLRDHKLSSSIAVIMPDSGSGDIGSIPVGTT